MKSTLLFSPTFNLLAYIEGRSPRRAFLAAIVFSMVISFTGVFDHSLWTPDEPRDAAIGREMLISGNLVVPTLAGKPFLEKPPLYWWVMAALYRVFGISDGVARTTSAIAGVMVLILVFDAGRRVASPFAGLLATMVTGTICGFFVHFHRVVVDPWLALFVMLGYWGFVLAAFGTTDSAVEKLANPSRVGILVVYLAAGLAFLTKGPVGPGLLFAPVVVSILVRKRWDLLRSRVHIPGILLLLSLCLSWPLALYVREGKDLFMEGFVIRNIFYRVIPPEIGGVHVGGHVQPFWYYAGFPPKIIPWLFTLPAVGHWLWHKRWPREWNGQALFFLASIFPVGLILLSMPGTKRMLYLLPLIAPLGTVIGLWLAAAVKNNPPYRFDHYTHLALFGISGVGVLVASGAMMWAYFEGANFLARFRVVLYSPPSAPLFFTFLGALVIVSSCLVIFGWRLCRSGSPQVGLVTLLLWVTLYVLGGPLYYSLGDGFKNLHYMTRDFNALRAFSPALVGYKLDETTEGLLPYDTGVVLRNIIDPHELERYFSDTPGGKLLMFEKLFPRLPAEVRSRLQPVRCWRFGDHRAYCLYECIPYSTR